MRKQKGKVEEVFFRLCDRAMIQLEELRSGSRRPMVYSLRFSAAKELVEHYGVSLAEAARILGVTTSAISKILHKRKDNYYNSALGRTIQSG